MLRKRPYGGGQARHIPTELSNRTEMQVKIEFQRKLHKRTGEKEINPKITFWEDFLEGSLELDVEIWVGFYKVDADVEK